MARFQVPQFIETKPKIIGPLTLPQFLYLTGAAGISFISFLTFNAFFAFLITAFVGAIAIALAFVKINGQTLPKILQVALIYVWQPKIYTWQRIAIQKTIELSSEDLMKARKQMTFQEKLKSLAQKVTTAKLISPLAKQSQNKKASHQVVAYLTGERKIAKRVDY